MEKISIIVPIYNVEDYLQRCIESLLCQTYENIEMILVDDGSTDLSGKICDDFQKRDKRVKVIHKQNGGVSSARNEGLRTAEGNYIGFVDADDYVEKNYVEELYKNLIENDCQVSICNYFEKKGVHIRGYKSGIKDKKVLSKREFYEKLIGNDFNGFLWNKLFVKKVFYDGCGKLCELEEDIHICEDLLYVVKIAQNVENFCYIPQKLYYYCLRGDSAYNQSYNSKKLSEIKAYDKILEIISKMFPELLLLYQQAYLNMALKLQDLFVHSKERNSKDGRIIKQAVEKYEITIMRSSEVHTITKLYYKTYKYLPQMIRFIKHIKHWILKE